MFDFEKAGIYIKRVLALTRFNLGSKTITGIFIGEQVTSWSLNQINSLQVWRDIYAARAGVSIDEPNVSFNIFGKTEDNAYLVLDIYTSDTSCVQYVFIPKNAPQRLAFLFDWLKHVDYSLENLLTLLEQLDYVEAEENVFPEADYEDMLISRRSMRAAED